MTRKPAKPRCAPGGRSSHGTRKATTPGSARKATTARRKSGARNFDPKVVAMCYCGRTTIRIRGGASLGRSRDHFADSTEVAHRYFTGVVPAAGH